MSSQTQVIFDLGLSQIYSRSEVTLKTIDKTLKKRDKTHTCNDTQMITIYTTTSESCDQ